MKKKLISSLLAAAMFAGTTTSFAATLKDVIWAATGSSSVVMKDIAVPTKIEVSKTQLGLAEASSTGVNYKTTIDMSNVKQKYEDYVALAKLAVGTDADLNNELDNCVVNGEFVIEITAPSDNFVFPDIVKTDKDMKGFGSTGNWHTAVFEEVDVDTQDANFRKFEEDAAQGKDKLTIKVKVKDNIGIAELKDKIADIWFEAAPVTMNAVGAYTVGVKTTGNTKIMSNTDAIGDITYGFTSPEATVTVVADTQGGGTGLGGIVKKMITVVPNNGEADKEHEYNRNEVVNVSEIPVPVREGYKFDGFYYDDALTQPAEGEIKMIDNVTLYVKWIEDKEIVPQPGVLNTDEHYAYIIGYPTEDGIEEVRPENNITREEVATIFYRLLKDDVRDNLFTTSNSFTDVDADRWSNKAISTMANGGYVKGYEDDSFQPAKDITRAEFVTIASRFFEVDESAVPTESAFTDTEGHWAKLYINYATSVDWIDGYGNGTFKPDQAITRAEVMKIVNNMLNRHVNAEGLVEAAKTWADNAPSAWYYYDVIEATNSHNYQREEGVTAETWTEITENQVIIEKPEYEDAE